MAKGWRGGAEPWSGSLEENSGAPTYNQPQTRKI